MQPGIRVVRGPDWDKKRQDGGEGHVGTIVYVPKSGSSDKKVTVIWDNGRELRYRAGHDGKYDLRVFDNGCTGEIHDTITCDVCKEFPLIGIRWKCLVCEDFDLCTKCYMDDTHDLQHGFLRYDKAKSNPIAVAPRANAKRRPILGVFKGAKVMRGPHWKWKNDDGGGSGEGDVLQIVTWNKSGYRGGAKVRWKDTKKEGVYRMGGEGCIDVIYINDVMSDQYYLTHLPVVDIVNAGEVVLKPSDKIRVNYSQTEFARLQDNKAYGGWNDEMVQCLKEIGTVVSIHFEGKTAKVQYLDGKNWLINAQAATRIHSFCTGEVVKIEKDVNSVRELQEGHGGWNSDMAPALGELGRIVRIDRDGDMKVKVKDRQWTFNPVVCSPVEDQAVKDKVPDLSKSELGSDKRDSLALSRDLDDAAAALADLFALFLRDASSRDDDDDDASLCEVSAKGDLDKVKTIIRRHPEQVNMKVEHKTPLHLASYEGQVKVMKCLLQNKADAAVTDEEGDTALHFAAFGGEEVALKMLLEHGVNKNAQNKKGLVPLHVTVGKANVPSTKLLMKYKASVNIKDNNGDTPMHDCILQTKKQQQLLQEVLQASDADFTICNNKGFDILQWATLKNCIRGAEIVLNKNKDIAKRQMKEGYTALHIAAANDHIEIASLLITKTPCNKNAKDNNERTSLHIAVSQKYKRTVELLINSGADVSAVDKDGNSPLHVAQQARPLADQLAQLLGVKKEHDDVGNQIMAMLIQAGANPEANNKKGETPISLCKDGSTREFMQKVHQQKRTNTFATTSKGGVLLPPYWSPMDNKEYVKRVQLDTSSGLMKAEFDAVENNFRRTMAQSQIVKIDRVQNKFAWEHYTLKKRQFEGEYGPGRSNEQSLFHGTTPDKVDTICQQNLDCRLAGDRVGTLFGQGSYFASEAKLSDGYATMDKNRHRFMFQVKVLAGKVALGDPEYKRPPYIKEGDPRSKLYDACVDDTNSPRIFCIFDQNQYYPEYIIEYI